MPCPECAHCQTAATVASLRLPAPPAIGGRGGVDLGYYRAFGAVYDLAARDHRQPMRAIREANPRLTASQCRDHLKRARALGYVTTPPRARRPAEPEAPTATVDDRLVLMRDGGYPVTPDALRVLGIVPPWQAGEYLERLVEDSLGLWNDDGTAVELFR